MTPEKFIGRQIREYMILELIGQGGMAAVLKAEHVKLKVIRALKIIRETFSQDRKFIDRFDREARLLVHLNHPNLVSIQDFFEEEGHLFLVMEYVPGESLATRLKRKGALSESEILPVIRQVLDGLAEAHRSGIVHRDISPENILLSPMPDGSERAVIIDFGIAKAVLTEDFAATLVSGLTSLGSFVGKMNYCSPEQAASLPVDGRSDIYSLGLVLHKALTGTMPFKADTPIDSMAMRRFNDLPKLKETMPSGFFPKELEELVARACARNADDRYPDADSFKEAILEYQKQRKRIAEEDNVPTETISPEEASQFVTNVPLETSPAASIWDISRSVSNPEKPLKRKRKPGKRSIYVLAIFLILGSIIAGAAWWLNDRGPAYHQPAPIPIRTWTPAPAATPRPSPDRISPRSPSPESTPTQSPTRIPTASPKPSKSPGSSSVPMIRINAGTFTMGSPSEEPGRFSNEIQHRVTITSAFFLGVTEVTQSQYESVMSANPAHFKGANRPVEQVSWNDAIEFCNQLSRQEGLTQCYRQLKSSITWDKSATGYRLPTEAEWEYACRAGKTGVFAWGSCLSTDDANYDGSNPLSGCGQGQNRKETWAVKSGKPNAWGFYDMHGNVWEWCWDLFDDYPSGDVTDPPVGASSGASNLGRGGSWYNQARFCRSAARVRIAPESHNYDLGFRVARSS
jgi:eukaryotic-like serine/threonine-protein kinase